MATSVDLDLEALLAPVSSDAPTGVDLRKTPGLQSIFTTAKDAFDAAVHWEEEAEKAKDPYLEPHERELKRNSLQPPDWNVVREQAAEILRTKSKDLRVAAWLVEALVHTDGIDGLLFGLQLLRNLCQTYWDEIHERADTAGRAMTVAPIGKLGRRLFLAALRAMPLMDSRSVGRLSLRDYRASQNLEAVADPEERQRRIEQDGVLPLAEFEAAAREVPAEEWAHVRQSLEASADELGVLNRWLNDRCGSDAPALAGVVQALHDSLEVLAVIAPASAAAAGDDATSSTGGGGGGKTPAGGTASAIPGAITTRQQAFEALRKVSQFFRDTEPQSPLAWQLERVVRLGQLNFPDLLAEVVRDPVAREAVAREVGTDVPESNE